MDRVWPSYGPVAGGTRVTITGQFANASAVKSVFFGTRKGIIDKQRLVWYTNLSVFDLFIFLFLVF